MSMMSPKCSIVENDGELMLMAGPLSEAKNALDGQLASTPEPIELCMASFQGLYTKGVSMMSPKCSIVENDCELMLIALHTHFLPQQ